MQILQQFMLIRSHCLYCFNSHPKENYVTFGDTSHDLWIMNIIWTTELWEICPSWGNVWYLARSIYAPYLFHHRLIQRQPLPDTFKSKNLRLNDPTTLKSILNRLRSLTGSYKSYTYNSCIGMFTFRKEKTCPYNNSCYLVSCRQNSLPV